MQKPTNLLALEMSLNVSSERKTYKTSKFYDRHIFISTMTCSTSQL